MSDAASIVDTARGLGLEEEEREILIRDGMTMLEIFRSSIDRMNARGERFDHPVPVIGGIIGNNLYKYINEDNILRAPAGPLFDRLYGSENYRGIKECYDQAEAVLTAVHAQLGRMRAQWDLVFATYPGHYWGCAKARGMTAFVHMDPWAKAFWVSRKFDDKLFRTVHEERFLAR